MVNKQQIRELVARNILPHWQRVDAVRTDAVADGFSAWLAENTAQTVAQRSPESRLPGYLALQIREELETLDRLRNDHHEFSEQLARTQASEDRRDHILEYARILGADRRGLYLDRRAFQRWFDADAVIDRYQRKLSERERNLVFLLRLLGDRAGDWITSIADESDRESYWRRLDLENLFRPILTYQGDERVRQEAFSSLARTLQALPQEARSAVVSDVTLQYIYRSSLQRQQDIWIQCESLSLLRHLSVETLTLALRDRIENPAEGDDIFVRRRAARVLCDAHEASPGLDDLFDTLLSDPSPAVRQALAEAIGSIRGTHAVRRLRTLARDDESPAVRASALLALAQRLRSTDERIELLDILIDCLEKEKDPFTVRAGMESALQCIQVFEETEQSDALDTWAEKLNPTFNRIHGRHPDNRVRRWAARTWEQIWALLDPTRNAVFKILKARLEKTRPGQSFKVPRNELENVDTETLGRILGTLTQDDFGCDVTIKSNQLRIVRGDREVVRSWRILHELLHSATDKRQGHRHTIGKFFDGSLRVPSGRLAELAETKVPGESVYQPDEDGPRSFLPLPDEAISVLDQGLSAKPVEIYTPEGVTIVTPPSGPGGRLAAWLKLSARYRKYARLRNWNDSDSGNPDDYVRALESLGFKIEFKPHSSESSLNQDDNVSRFFSLGSAIPMAISMNEVMDKLHEYFFSMYENSLAELLVFTGTASALFAGRQWIKGRNIRQARNRIPLVIGGWGTRGKSGTERLKAAMFNALGSGTVAKSTGCEAMFLHAHPFGPLREMFIFRPYDKATIWEQGNLVELSADLDTDVFLWECMALTPRYVRIMQERWMQDDISTITNAYPDHEDIQGPTGRDVAEAISTFIPCDSRLLTSEEQMLPILKAAASANRTSVKETGWLEAGLLTPDMLERFPYEEHPYNVALVLSLADELGIDRDYAIKEMADRVIPDIGVLKIYPEASIDTRRIQFVNGMSANERFGALSNWSRCDFDQLDRETHSDTWVTTLINNRADRVPRSRTFAQMIVEDLSADQHILIGTNLKGLRGFISDSWNVWIREQSIFDDRGGSPTEQWQKYARRLRIPTTRETIGQRAKAMLSGMGEEVTDTELDQLTKSPAEALSEGRWAEVGQVKALQDHLQRDVSAYEAFEDLKKKISSSAESDRKRIDHEFRRLMTDWFDSRIVIVDDPHATGNQIVRRIVDETPPGLLNKVMGMQNIKGTGLDFVYTWQAWDRIHRAGTRMLDRNDDVAFAGLTEISSIREHNLLSAEWVDARIQDARTQPRFQRERTQAQLTLTESHLKVAMDQLEDRLTQISRQGWIVRILETIEAFLDVGDSVRRRKKADRIYRDLVTMRIAHERAARELQELNRRQKGGWLYDGFRRLFRRNS